MDVKCSHCHERVEKICNACSCCVKCINGATVEKHRCSKKNGFVIVKCKKSLPSSWTYDNSDPEDDYISEEEKGPLNRQY